MTPPLSFRKFVCFCLFFAFFAPRAFAAERYNFVLEKQEEKAKSRWSLAEWVDQRDRRRMMDLWLALHSPSPFEFYIGADYSVGRQSSAMNFSRWNLNMVGYASIFGLEVQYQDSSVARGWTGLGHLRIFGLYSQATNITLVGGIQQQNRSGYDMINPLFGASMTVYVNRFAGVEFHYRHLLNHARFGQTIFANKYQLGAFLDFKFLRFYGGYITEIEGGSLALSPSGAYLGFRFYF